MEAQEINARNHAITDFLKSQSKWNGWDVPYHQHWEYLMDILELLRHEIFAIELTICLGTIVKIRYNDQWHIYESNDTKEAIWAAIGDYCIFRNMKNI